MPRRAPIALLVLALAHAGPEAQQEPICRCVLAAVPAGTKTVSDTGLPEMDQRLKSESNFLKSLFKVEPQLLLLADGAARDAFAVDAAPGSVALRAGWLKERWDSDHRAATVAVALAHQWAHVLQAQRGCKLPEMARELHADLLAGWYLGRRNFASLKSGPVLDAAFAASLFADPAEFLNERFEHGASDARVRALCEGFRLFRMEKLSLDKVYAKGLKLFPPPKVGMADEGPKPEGLLGRIKIECTHRAACTHRVACKHPQPCVHKVACKHEAPCVHRSPCIHKVACEHKIPCVHRVKIERKVPCVHTIPCRHKAHDFDRLHERCYDGKGNPIECPHTVPCTHYLHDFDYLHNFDYEYDWDFEHEFDRMHEFDMAHEFDTEHPFDPAHEFDMAHDWDPVHEFDLAHEWDPPHDYDVRYVPAEDAAGGPGAK
jgi:hypothetical protein